MLLEPLSSCIVRIINLVSFSDKVRGLVGREGADAAPLLRGRDLDLVPVRPLEQLPHLLHKVPLRLVLKLRIVNHRLNAAAAAAPVAQVVAVVRGRHRNGGTRPRAPGAQFNTLKIVMKIFKKTS